LGVRKHWLDGSRGFATLYYLGREQDETDTLAKALAHWEKAIALAERELKKSRASAGK
jgi:hypothetical protein